MRTLKPNQHGQVTIPADFRRQLGIEPTTELEAFLNDDGEIVLRPAMKRQRIPFDQIRSRYKPTLSREEMDRLLEDNRSEI